MALDIYLRVPTDPNYDSTQLEVADSVDNFIQMIEMILTTDKTEVFGEPGLGIGLESFLWNPNISTGTIKTEINRQILLYCPNGIGIVPYEIDINFVKGDIYDTMLVDIIIDNQKVLGIAATPSSVNQKNSAK